MWKIAFVIFQDLSQCLLLAHKWSPIVNVYLSNLMCMCPVSQQAQLVLHHHVWLAHHLALSWVCKVNTQSTTWQVSITCTTKGNGGVLHLREGGRSPLRMSSKPMYSSLPCNVSTARFELCKNGRRWIWRRTQGGRKWAKKMTIKMIFTHPLSRPNLLLQQELH